MLILCINYWSLSVVNIVTLIQFDLSKLQLHCQHQIKSRSGSRVMWAWLHDIAQSECPVALLSCSLAVEQYGRPPTFYWPRKRLAWLVTTLLSRNLSLESSSPVLVLCTHACPRADCLVHVRYYLSLQSQLLLEELALILRKMEKRSRQIVRP